MNQNPETNNNENVEEKINVDSQNSANGEPKAENSQQPYNLNGQQGAVPPYNPNMQQGVRPPYNPNMQQGVRPPYNPNGQPYQPPYNPNGQPFGYPPVNANGQPVYPQNNQPQKKGGSGMSIAGFVMSLVSLLCCCLGPYISAALAVLGLVFSIIGIVSSKKTGKANGLAIAGVVISVVSIIFWGTMIAIVLYLGEEGINEILKDYPEYERYM
ncbi:MAG: hypothetical protein J6V36_00790 [Clostridia bacterium]|nr:hypothetical protein [Clostridia bacterium]